MNSIIVGFSKPKTWKPFAALIMWGYNIPYDHVYIKLHSNTYNRDLIYQASGISVNFMSPIIFNNLNSIIKEFNLSISDQAHKAMIQFAIDTVGKPYGIKECLGLAIVRIAELLGKKIKNPFKFDGKTYVCSELASFMLKEYLNLNLDQDINLITPKDLYTYLDSIENK